MSAAADPEDAEACLAAYPETETVDLLIADLNGTFVVVPELPRIYRQTEESERRSFLREVTPAERALHLRAV